MVTYSRACIPQLISRSNPEHAHKSQKPRSSFAHFDPSSHSVDALCFQVDPERVHTVRMNRQHLRHVFALTIRLLRSTKYPVEPFCALQRALPFSFVGDYLFHSRYLTKAIAIGPPRLGRENQKTVFLYSVSSKSGICKWLVIYGSESRRPMVQRSLSQSTPARKGRRRCRQHTDKTHIDGRHTCLHKTPWISSS
jgi:hypothetical protein